MTTLLIINTITNILLTLAVLAIIVLNVIITKEAIQRELTFSEIISENQDTKLGQIFMGLLAIPSFIILYIKSLLPIKSYFDEDGFEFDDDCYEDHIEEMEL